MTTKSLRNWLIFSTAVTSVIYATTSYASNYENRTISQLQVDNRPCVFFWLGGVSQADPVVPNQAWFALPKTAGNYQEMLSELLSSKLTGKPIYVVTDGTVSCGFATVVEVGFDQ